MSTFNFRAEVTSHRSASPLGHIAIEPRPAQTLVTLGIVALCAALLVFCGTYEVSRRVTVPGVILPPEGVVQIAAPQGGRVERLLVEEGARVQQDQPLASVRNERHAAAGSAFLLTQTKLQRQRKSLQEEQRTVTALYQLKQADLAAQAQQLLSRSARAASDLETAQRRLQLAKAKLERYRELHQDGFVSDLQLQAAEETQLDVEDHWRELGARINDIRFESSQHDLQRKALKREAAKELGKIERQITDIDKELSENEVRLLSEVKAPRAGIIGSVLTTVGTEVVPGQTLISLLPDTSNRPDKEPALQAAVFATSREAGFIRAGQTSLLKIDAYPYQKFGTVKATVLAITETPVDPDQLARQYAFSVRRTAASNEPVYRITLRLHRLALSAPGAVHRLKTGLTIQASLMRETKSGLDWLIDPIVTAAGVNSVLNANRPD